MSNKFAAISSVAFSNHMFRDAHEPTSQKVRLPQTNVQMALQSAQQD